MLNTVQKARIDFINNRPNFFIQNSNDYKEIIFKRGFNFIPLNIKYLNNSKSNLVYSNLVEAFSFMIDRPDVAFDYLWKIFEEFIWKKDLVKRLQKYSKDDLNFLNELFLNIPLQSYWFIYKRLEVANQLNLNKKDIDKNVCFYDSWEVFIDKKIMDYIKTKLWSDRKSIVLKADKTLTISPEQKRDWAIFLKNLVNTKKVNIDWEDIFISDFWINFLVIYGYLFTFKDTRTNNLAMSPFISSKVTLWGYLHCHYAFLITYYLVMNEINNEFKLELTSDDFIENISLNIKNLHQVFWKTVFE